MNNNNQTMFIPDEETMDLSVGMNLTKEQMEFSFAIDQRKVVINEEITEQSVFRYLFYLHKIVEIDAYREEIDPIEIYINTDGGSVYDCLTLISYLEFLKDRGYHIITINIGRAFSAGFLLSVIGNERKSLRYSRYMFHEVSGEVFGKHQTMRSDLDEFNTMSQIGIDIILKYTNIPISTLNDIIAKKEDRYFSPEDMLKLGAIDEIL
jgi:ATP-dependent protease ClpP protease subunit